MALENSKYKVSKASVELKKQPSIQSVGLEVSGPEELGGDQVTQIVLIQIQGILLCHEEEF